MKRLKAYLLIALAYILALVVGYIVWKISITTVDEILALFLANISAPIVIWIFGILFHNSSFYDSVFQGKTQNVDISTFLC